MQYESDHVNRRELTPNQNIKFSLNIKGSSTEMCEMRLALGFRSFSYLFIEYVMPRNLYEPILSHLYNKDDNCIPLELF